SQGAPKLLRSCTLPLTGAGVVHRVITDLGVFDITQDGFAAVELAPNVTAAQVQQASGALVRF
ncbi:MAG: succinyl-CoA--3-ketoacid-CoA transferase, partial [Acidobacteriota bacterium]